MDEYKINKKEQTELVAVLKKYCNLYKALYHVDQSSAAEFKRKQEIIHREHDHDHHHGCCGGETEFVIPKDLMNNIEKNLKECYDEIFYPSGLEDILRYSNEKFERIIQSGIKQGLKLDDESEKELIHRILLEGIPFYIADKLRRKLTKFEGSISEQPMLLAHPSGVKDESLLNFLSQETMSELVERNYALLHKKIYNSINEYELFNQFKYLYIEGYFEDSSTKSEYRRSDYILNYHAEYFKKSKHSQVNEISYLIRFLPYELNKKFPLFSLQVNDYIQASYFRENFSYVQTNMDSSFEKDTGKKMTLMLVLFPEDLPLEKRQLRVILDKEVVLISPLSGMILKSRKQSYEIPKHEFSFVILFYYIHGPVDKESYTC